MWEMLVGVFYVIFKCFPIKALKTKKGEKKHFVIKRKCTFLQIEFVFSLVSRKALIHPVKACFCSLVQFKREGLNLGTWEHLLTLSVLFQLISNWCHYVLMISCCSRTEDLNLRKSDYPVSGCFLPVYFRVILEFFFIFFFKDRP